MIAQIISYAGTGIGTPVEQLGLLLARPDWSSDLKVELQLPTDVARAPISTRESRRSFAQSARYSIQWRAYLDNAADATELRIFLTRLKGEMVAAPMWTDGVEIATNVAAQVGTIPTLDTPVRSGLEWIILANDNSAYEIVTVNSMDPTRITLSPWSTKAWPAGTMMFPLIFGRLSERPRAEAITDETLEVDLKVQENSPFARRLNPYAGSLPITGLGIPGFALTPIWNIAPHWSRPLDWTETDIAYYKLGFGRQEEQHVYPGDNRRGLEHEFGQSGREEIARVERFFVDRRAQVRPFFIPTFRGDLRLAQDVAALSTTVRIEPSEFTDPARAQQNGDPYIALIDEDGSVAPAKIGVNSTGVLTAVAPFAGAHPVETTKVSHLLYARFVENKLSWTYSAENEATTRLKFMELVREYLDPPVALPEPAYLIHFTYALPVPIYYAFTSYENSIRIPGIYHGTYTPAPFEFGSVKTGLKLDQEKLDLKSRPFPGNPLGLFFPFALDALLNLTILEVDVNNLAAEPVVRFYGEVWEVDPTYKATCLAFGNFFERKFPMFLLSRTDNYTIYSGPTRLNPATFQIAGTIEAMNGVDAYVFITSAAANAKAVDYFSGGYLDTTGPNPAEVERRSILKSEPSVGGVQLKLDRPLLKQVLGGPVAFYPGYDGTIEQCDTRFGNLINFGGHPYIPDTNPAVRAMKAKEVEGGKKG